MKAEKVFALKFSGIYPLYVKKVESKARTSEELDRVLQWLTGYTAAGLAKQIAGNSTLEEFFAKSPKFNPNAALIKGVVCGVRVEEVEDPLMQKIRYMDKLVDELAKGKKMESILRSAER